MANQPPKGEQPPGELAAPRTVDTNIGVTLHPADARPQADRGPVPLWIAIANRRTDYNAYAKFVRAAFCEKPYTGPSSPVQDHMAAVMRKSRTDNESGECVKLGWLGHGINAYELLKTATEIFLLLECGVFVAAYNERDAAGNEIRTIPGVDAGRVDGDIDLASLQSALSTYLGGGHRLPYIARVIEQNYGGVRTGESGPGMALVASPLCEGLLRSRVDCPCFLELIWSYWHEEGMLVQALNALSMRFQNRRTSDGRDPLAQLELSPLRPLSSILWGYVQDEQHRLSLVRRAYEYEHEYGVALRGKAVPQMRPADRRSKFIESFHDLLYRCATFYRELANLQYNPDPFPLLNGLKEVHLVLSQGAGNQFGDLPWTARVEMMMQQWILARPEIREFLGRRPMVVYEEDWMANADALKSMMGWSDTSITHFRNLAVFGEQLLLTIRWHSWASETDASVARDWANFFRPQIQGYLHAYRVATGVDLGAEPKGGQDSADRSQSPSALLERRLLDQRREAGTEAASWTR